MGFINTNKILGTIGGAITKLGNIPQPFTGVTYNQIAQKIAPNFTIASSLRNLGGNPAGSTFQWVPAVRAAEQTPPSDPYNPYLDPNNYAKPPAGTGGDGGGTRGTGQVLGQQSQQQYPQQQSQQQSSGPSIQDLINQAYDAQMGSLNTLEQKLPGQAEEAKQYWTGEQAAVAPVYQQEQTTRLGELQTREGQAQQKQQLETAKVKQLLSELQNRQATQLAYTGGYGSSANPAMAEAFGKQAFSSMGNLGYQGQQVMDSINSEKERVKNFYSNATATLDQKVREAKANIQSELNDKLNNITMAKGEAGRGKAQSTLEAWQSYANNITSLNLENKQWQQNIQAWALEKGKSLEAAQKFALQSTGGFNPAEYTFNPNQSMSTGLGQQAYTPPVKVSKATGNYSEEEKRLAAQLGVTPDQVRGVSQGMGNYQTFQ